MEVKEIDTLTALSSGIKEQYEKCIYALSHPTKIEQDGDMVIILQKIATDLTADDTIIDLCNQMAMLLQIADVKKEDLPIFQQQFNFIINQMPTQVNYVMNEQIGLKFGSLSFKKGPRQSTMPVDLKGW